VIFTQLALEKELGFALECLPQVAVELGVRLRVGRHEGHVSDVQPLARKVGDQVTSERARRSRNMRCT
jgi:hypothetical protein